MPQEVLDSIPNVDLVYWDYYHEDQKIYDQLIENHLAIGKKVILLVAAGRGTALRQIMAAKIETTKAVSTKL